MTRAEPPGIPLMSVNAQVHRVTTDVRLIRPDDLLGHLDVQDRPHVSTTVVSTALATGLSIRRPLTFRLSAGGERWRRPRSLPCRHSAWPLRNRGRKGRG